MKTKFKKIILLFSALNLCAFLSAQNSSAVRIASAGANTSGKTVLADAYNAYHEGDYKSAQFLFRKAFTDRRFQSADSLYMLIMAGMHSSEYKTAYADAEYFLSIYPESEYAPIVKYQMGRALFNMGDYDKSLITLGDFCHEYPDNMMYASALFWIGECFYAGYNFDEAEPFYERVVTEYPDDSKAVDAQYRLDTINAKKREQKLLYMLQETGENYLSSKENYEKTLRRYELENLLNSKNDSNKSNDGIVERDADIFIFEENPESLKNLESEFYGSASKKQEEEQNQEEYEAAIQRYQDRLPPGKTFSGDSFDMELLRLKAAALEAQVLLDEGNRR